MMTKIVGAHRRIGGALIGVSTVLPLLLLNSGTSAEQSSPWALPVAFGVIAGVIAGGSLVADRD